MPLPSGQGAVMAPSVAGPSPVGISPDQLQAIASARLRARKINRAASVAAVSGWTLGVFAAFSLLMGIFDLSSFLLGAVLAVAAHVELKGSKGLRKFDPATPRRLAMNQAFLGVMLIAYGAWGLVSSITTPSPYAPYISQGGQVGDLFKSIQSTTSTITICFYVMVICLSAMAQGCSTWYYASRARHLRDYLATTEPWVLQALRAAA